MTNKSKEDAYRTYCKNRLLVSRSTKKVDVDDTIKTIDKEKNHLFGKIKNSITCFKR